MVVLENEQLRLEILADKGADVASLAYKPTDTEFLFRTPWGARDPRTHGATDGNGVAAFFDRYEGGWQTVLPNFGFLAEHGGASFGLHGEASTVPWDVAVVEEGPERAAVRFRVRLARSPFVVVKELALEAGSPTLVLTETVRNVGEQDMALSYGQHIALGPPFLSPACVVDLPGGTVLGQPELFHDRNRLAAGTTSPWPTTPARDGGAVDLREIAAPEVGSYDMVYVAEMPDGWYAVTNRDLGVGIAVRYPVETFRYLWYWQSFGGGTDYPWWGQTYNIGLEPVTSWPNGGLEEQIANGSAWHLAAGAEHTVEVRLTAYRSRTGVQAVAADGTVAEAG